MTIKTYVVAASYIGECCTKAHLHIEKMEGPNKRMVMREMRDRYRDSNIELSEVDCIEVRS